MTKKSGDSDSTPSAQPLRNPIGRPFAASGRLPGTGVRRDLKETWGSIKSKSDSEQVESNNAEARLLKVNRLSPNPNQPRRTFDAERDAELATDVKERGILEPILVRAIGEDEEGSLYQIVAGERRYRAALTAGLNRVPVIIKNYNDNEARFTSLVENLQRVDLDPLDEAYYYRTLSEDYNYSYREIGKMVNRSPAYISERLKRLPGMSKNAIFGDETDEAGTKENSGKTVEDSELSNKRLESKQKLQNSQLDGVGIKPVHRFREYLIRTRERVVKMKEDEREILVNEIKELKKHLSELEEEITKSAVPRETNRKR